MDIFAALREGHRVEPKTKFDWTVINALWNQGAIVICLPPRDTGRVVRYRLKTDEELGR